MDSFKFIPQLFYDFLGRLIPGTIALYLGAIALSSDPVQVYINIFSASQAFFQSTAVPFITIGLSAYILGQFIGPLGNLVRSKLLTKVYPKFYNLLRDTMLNVNSDYPPAIQKYLKDEASNVFETTLDKKSISEEDDSSFRLMTYIWYDWIRAADPAIGTRLAKIRAEFRMLENICVVAGIAFVLHPIAVFIMQYQQKSLCNFLRPWFIFLAASISICASWAAAHRFRTFQRAVLQYYYNLKTQIQPTIN